MNTISPAELAEVLLTGTGETLYMVGVAAVCTLLVGLPLGVLLFLTSEGAPIGRASGLHAVLSAVVNVGRSLPFIILLIAVIPLTRFIAGTTLGSTAAIVPLTLAAAPFYARVVQLALQEVDRGRIEAAVAMGATLGQIVHKVLLPEALPGLLAGVTLTVVVLVSFSAMAGVVGGGGLGDLAVRYGYERFNTEVMLATVVVLVILVQLIQTLGDWLVRRLAHRR
jgi:D-methionine transport system permease protein